MKAMRVRNRIGRPVSAASLLLLAGLLLSLVASAARSGRIYFPVAEEDSRYPRKAIVSGLEIDGRFKAYPFPELARGPSRFGDRFQGMDIEVAFDEAN